MCLVSETESEQVGVGLGFVFAEVLCRHYLQSQEQSPSWER